MSQTNIHPKFHNVNVKLTNGETMEIKTSWGKEGDTLTLDTDPFKHNAWKEGDQQVIRSTKNDGENKKFAGFDSLF